MSITSQHVEPRCLGCGYLLVGLTNLRCPECGRDFDPSDSRTFDNGCPKNKLAISQLRRPGKFMTVVAGIAALLMIFSAASPGMIFPTLMLGTFAWMVLGGYYILRLSIWLVLHWYFKRAVDDRTGMRNAWIWPPTICATMAILLVLNAPLRIAFLISKPWMSDLAATAAHTPNQLPRRAWVGLYYADEIQPIPGGVRFLVRGSGFLDRMGFCYSPDREPPVIGEDYYRPLGGGWYEWEESW